jgi:hypothetical protein
VKSDNFYKEANMRTSTTRKQRKTAPKKESKWGMYLILGAIAIGIIGLGYLLYLSLLEPEALDELQRFAGLSRGHDETVEYADLELPPVGGLHSGVWQNCGIYTDPIEAKNAVHSMEHGAVWIAHQPGIGSEDIDTLHDLVRGERYVLLSPYPNLKSPIVLTAWGIQLELESASDARIAQFVDQYQQGPQTPELGATCSNGTGLPIN